MNNTKKLSSAIRTLISPEGSDIRVHAFNILAICGIAVSLVTGFYNLAAGFGIVSFLECMSGVVMSVLLMVYTRKTGNYRFAMVLTVLFVFLGLFTFLYFTNGCYLGGVPYFFIFATVFTAFLLDGVIMPVLIVVELVWYAVLCMYTYYHPTSSFLSENTKVRVFDLVVCESIVSVSLAITMYYQIRVYRKKQQELNVAIEAAEKANRAKSDFLAKMSHDVRTPLNTIMATNELIVANTSSARIREWVNDSNVSGRILISMIDDLLDLSRIEAGGLNLLEQPWDTRQLFEESAKIWKLNADKAGLQFKCEIAEDVPAFLNGDESLIRKVVDNLLSNAVKYTKKGSVSLLVAMEEQLTIRVADTGVGIAAEYLEKIFRPFERGVEDIYRETSGSGLGLAIVKELVDAMGGTIDCDSVPGEGTTFTVRLPQKVAGGKGEETTEGAETEGTGGTTMKQFVAPDARILVVDDNSYNRKVIEGFLEPTLIRIDDVESGFDALEMIDIRDYDLVLMDLRMPKMDGAETLERIRKEYPDFKAPVIALTADIMNGIEQKLLQAGFDAFLAKPVSSAKLLEAIAERIGDKIVPLAGEEEREFSAAKMESFQDMLRPYGVDLKLALEYSAGNAEEFLTRASLFEEYADAGMEKLRNCVSDEDFYLQIHSVKSIARGVGAYLLAELAETLEYRKDAEYAKTAGPLLLAEYERVRSGLGMIRKEL
ncbi:MAG: response regulator [Lachnospiraceae bacterium]|nr:response regulator [Lachnospiraceae bacterium]